MHWVALPSPSSLSSFTDTGTSTSTSFLPHWPQIKSFDLSFNTLGGTNNSSILYAPPIPPRVFRYRVLRQGEKGGMEVWGSCCYQISGTSLSTYRSIIYFGSYDVHPGIAWCCVFLFVCRRCFLTPEDPVEEEVRITVQAWRLTTGAWVGECPGHS